MMGSANAQTWQRRDPRGGAIALTLARLRLLVADAYRLGRRGEQDGGKDAARRLVADALDLELALKSVADAGRLETGQRYVADRAAGLSPRTTFRSGFTPSGSVTRPYPRPEGEGNRV
jgi:hypothetical protein